MSKLICDICGTTYPDTADCCPICGYSPNGGGSDEFIDDIAEEPAGIQNQQRKEIFDYDEVNGEYDEENTYEQSEYDDEEEEEEEAQTNTLAVVILTIVIALLLMAAGFIFVRYFMPNMGGKGDKVQQVTQAAEEISTETTVAGIPCQELYIISGKAIELNEPGQLFLISAKANPENTTDAIIFQSADESIATVTEDGRVTAVSEGETVVTISCGVSVMECPVTVRYIEDTVPPAVTEAETIPDETAAETNESTEETTSAAEPTETQAAASAQTNLKNVTLKLKKTDIRLGVYYEYKLLLDCPLEQNEVQWNSEHPHIASVDENGVVKAIKSGTTAIIATYGDQKVQCIIRCS